MLRRTSFSHRVQNSSPITNDQIIELASSAGALAPIEGVSDRYSFVPTLAAVDLLRDAGWLPVHAEQSRSLKEERDGFQRHMIRFIMPGLDQGGERVDMVLYNSHDRGCAFKLAASVWRKICGNGLMVASEFANFSHKHLGFNPESFVTSARQIASTAGIIAGRVNEMKVIEMEPDERGIYAQVAHQLVYGEDSALAPISHTQLLNERRLDDKGKDLWTTFNVVQENIMRGGIHGFTANGRRSTTREVKSITRNVNLNHALWALTEKMAELKKAA